MCRLRRLPAGLTPGGMRRELTAGKAQALLARIRPGDDVARVRLQLARGHLAGIRAPGARLKTAAARIGALVAAAGTTLTALYGIGPLIAGRILAGAGDIARSASKDKFAGCNGTAPARRVLRGAGAPPAVAGREPPELPCAAHDGGVRITCDPAAAACIHLTGERLTRGRTTIPATPPEGVQAFIVLDWKEDRLAGIEVLDASSRLHPGLPGEAEILS